MTGAKKDYILDALGEVKDDFVAEAATYKKQRTGWKYGRELGAAAACVVAVLVTIKTVENLPIHRGNESTVSVETSNQHNNSQKEMFEDEQIRESAVAESAPVYSQGIICELVASKAEDWKDTDHKEEVHKQALNAAKTEALIGDSKIFESVQSESCLAWMSAEEIFGQGNDIFRGIVKELQVYRVTGKINQYFTVATVEVTDNIRGTQQNGEMCRIYMPIAKMDDIVESNSLIGELENLEVGSEAIFMPRTATETTGLGRKDQGEWLCYADFADYYFSEGIRYLFLETENGVSYEKNVYEIPGENITLDDVANYIRKKLEN